MMQSDPDPNHESENTCASFQSGPSSPMTRATALSIFMCQSCNTVLTDGQSLCQINNPLMLLGFLGVTNNVVTDSVLCHGSSELEDCTFYWLRCRSCENKVGIILRAATTTFGYLLDLFCLYKDSVLCYLLETKKIVKGSDLHFNFSHSCQLMQKLEKQTCAANNHLNAVAQMHLIQETDSE